MVRTVSARTALIDLVVFGRAAAIQAQVKVVDRDAPNPDAESSPLLIAAFDRFDGLRHANGDTVGTAELRLEMQKAMQADAAVFRTDKTLAKKVWHKMTV